MPMLNLGRYSVVLMIQSAQQKLRGQSAHSGRGHFVSRVVHLSLLLAVVATWHVEQQVVQRLVFDTAVLAVDLEALPEA